MRLQEANFILTDDGEVYTVTFKQLDTDPERWTATVNNRTNMLPLFSENVGRCDAKTALLVFVDYKTS